MPISITALKPGDTVWDVHSERAGNTTMRRVGRWPVRIISVDAEAGKVVASWNCNPPRTYHARNGKLPWRRSKPATV